MYLINNYMTTPYTYLIGWTDLDKWYYGVRYADGCHPDELWVTYFTSSAVVNQLRKEHGEPDIKQIRRTFNDPAKALLWEETVLQRLQVDKHLKWVNLRAGSWPISILSEETKRKHKAARNKRPPASDETRRKMSEARRGRKMSEETKRKISEANKGKRRTVAERTKMSEAQKNKSPETIAKLKESLSGRQLSEEHKANISRGLQGKVTISDAQRAAISQANRGRIHTESSKQKMRDAAKRRTLINNVKDKP